MKNFGVGPLRDQIFHDLEFTLGLKRALTFKVGFHSEDWFNFCSKSKAYLF